MSFSTEHGTITSHEEIFHVKEEPDVCSEQVADTKEHENPMDNKQPFCAKHSEETLGMKEEPEFHSGQVAEVKQETVTNYDQNYWDFTVMGNRYYTQCEELTDVVEEDSMNLKGVKHEPGSNNKMINSVKHEDYIYNEPQSEFKHQLMRDNEETADIQQEVDLNDNYSYSNMPVDSEKPRLNSEHNTLQVVPLTAEQNKDAKYSVIKSHLCPHGLNTSVDLRDDAEMHQDHKFSDVFKSHNPVMAEQMKQNKVVHSDEMPNMCRSPCMPARLLLILDTPTEKYSCDMCQYTGKKLHNLNRHKKTHTGEKPYSCDMCTYTCNDVGNLKKHKLTHVNEKTYSCDMCQYTSKQKVQLKVHKMIHAGEKPYSCDMCQYVCVYPGDLTKHKMTHTNEKPYSCEVCQFRCRKAWDLEQHKMIHSEIKAYACDMCSYTCKVAVYLTRHKREHRRKNGTVFSCDVCHYSCKNMRQLKDHKNTHTEERPYTCNMCQYNCRTAFALRKHKMTHTGEKPYSCDKCQHACKTAWDLKKHKMTHTREKPFSCDVCEYTCKFASYLKRHKQSHENNSQEAWEKTLDVKKEPYVNIADLEHKQDSSNEMTLCVEHEDDICHEQLPYRKDQLDRQSEEISDLQHELHPNNGNSYSGISDKMLQPGSEQDILQLMPHTKDVVKDTQYTMVRSQFNPRDSGDSSHDMVMNHNHEPSNGSSSDTPQMTKQMRQNRVVRSGKKSDMNQYSCGKTGLKKLYMCDLCPYTCKKPSILKTHKMTHEGEYPFSCDICKYTCREAGSLKRHKMRHTGEKPYSCDMCVYKCRDAGSMKVHRRTHTGEKPYSCDMCQYACKTAWGLKKHRMTHTGENPYSCDLCTYKCKQAGNLQKHKMIHTNEKPYSCDLCMYTCRDAGSLKRHKMRHTSEKPYSCDICQFRCRHTWDLKRHKMTHTNIKPYSYNHKMTRVDYGEELDVSCEEQSNVMEESDENLANVKHEPDSDNEMPVGIEQEDVVCDEQLPGIKYEPDRHNDESK